MKMMKAKALLSKMVGGVYHSVTYEVHEHTVSDVQQDCTMYADGYAHVHGATWQEALDKMRNLVKPKPIKPITPEDVKELAD